jgi:inhibitor of cysteine peptidase
MAGVLPCSLVLMALMAAAGGAPARRLGPADNGGHLTLTVGERFTLELRQNPTTGYSWSVVSSGEPVIHQEGQPSYKPDGEQRGGGGTLSFAFRGAAAGRTELRLVYARPWEKDVAPADTFRLTVDVAP